MTWPLCLGGHGGMQQAGDAVCGMQARGVTRGEDARQERRDMRSEIYLDVHWA